MVRINRTTARVVGFLALAMALLGGCVAVNQLANPLFVDCDGYGGVKGVIDGISTESRYTGASGDRIRRATNVRTGRAQCDAALLQLQTEKGDLWMRKVSLLQSRALHDLEADDKVAAFADLDAADAAAQGRGDVYFRRSLGQNTQMIRALAHWYSGQHDKADAIVKTELALRPYSRQTIRLGHAIQSLAASSEAYESQLVAGARLDPSLSQDYFLYLYGKGRYSEALAIVDEVVAPVPVQDQPDNPQEAAQQAEIRRVTRIAAVAEIGGMQAEAFALLGQTDKALSMLKKTRTDFDAALRAPTSPVSGQPDAFEQDSRKQADMTLAYSIPQKLERWSTMVSDAIAKSAGRISPRLPDLQTTAPVSANSQSAVTIGAVTAPPVSRVQPPLVSMAFSLLNDAETELRANYTVKYLDGAFMNADYKARGTCEEKDNGDGLIPVCFASSDATLAIAGEKALLRAARITRAAGASAFSIDWRTDTHLTLIPTGNPIVYGAPFSAGYTVRLGIRLIADPTQAQNCWRCLNPDEIERALSAIYTAPVTGSPSRS